MEESEQRRERLKAMRMEAAEVEVSPNVHTSMPTGHLNNPLLESSSVQERSPSAWRFDFYTDPMAAFSGNKRGNSHMYQTPPNCFSPPVNFASPVTRPSPYLSAGPRNLDATPSPSHQLQRMHEAPSPYHSSNTWRSPVGISTPFPGHRGTPPGAWNRSGGPAGYGFSPNSSRFGGLRTPGFGRGFFPSPSPSPNSNSGRGSSPRFINSPNPGSGRGGGRGRGFHACVSAREKPELFYNKSMVEDPWRMLKPVVRSLVGSEGSWLPKSIGMKKARTSESTSKSSSRPSLAEYLAASLEEASDDVTNV
ncbi:hypothetical protein BVC80_9075g96 [Macleaya cordata]|uniref:M-phase-specific PLK1-interacting protein-like n=1 Tax=Macleaya cordata TaxID=56857 RepID=A0A200PUF3_MACCD|nr:hypothetical protein BVC80_9075g96 [Macleaya cordata]